MTIDFAETPVPLIPPPAPSVELRGVADEAGLRAMYDIVDVAFNDHFGHESETYAEWHRQNPEGACPDLSLYWIATVDGTPAAGLYATEVPGLGYVDTLGTLREFRGRGLARALLLTAFHEFHRRGIDRVALGVDATNPTGALELYQSVGMIAAHEAFRYQLT